MRPYRILAVLFILQLSVQSLLITGQSNASFQPPPSLLNSHTSRSLLPTRIQIESLPVPKSSTRITPIPNPLSPPQATSSPGKGVSGHLAQLSDSSPSVGVGLSGLDLFASGGYVPPDVQVATGPQYIVEMVNVAGEIWTRQGTSVKTFDLHSFFGFSGFGGDPRIVFDSLSQRWFASMFVGSVSPYGVNLAVSQTSNPNDNWWLYNFPDSYFPDQPLLATSDDKLLISVNAFTCLGSCPSAGAQYWVLTKADLLSGAAASFVSFGPNPGLFSVHPAQALTSSTTLYLVSSTSFSCCSLWSVTGVPTGTVTITQSSLAVSSYSYPPRAVQQGSSVLIDTGDTRVQDAYWSQGKLWLAFNVGCNPAGDTQLRTCLRFVEMDTVVIKVDQDFDVGANGKYFFYPAFRQDNSGNLIAVFGYSSSSDYPGLMLSGRAGSSPPNTFEIPIVLKAGVAPETSGRYGDYFGAAADPSDPTIVWVAGEYGATSEWATSIAAVNSEPGGLLGEYWRGTFFGTTLPAYGTCATYSSPSAPTSPPTSNGLNGSISFGSSTGFQWRPFGNVEFSVKWIGFIRTVPDGTYGFQLTSDDGSWLFIDSSPILSRGGLNNPQSSTSGNVSLSGGTHRIEVDFYETCDQQSGVDLSWMPPGTTSFSIVPSLVLTPPPMLDGEGTFSGSCATSRQCQVLSTTRVSDVVVLVVDCQNKTGTPPCGPDSTFAVTDSLGLNFTQRSSFCYPGSFISSCSWEYYAVPGFSLTNDSIAVTFDIPSYLQSFTVFAVSGANLQETFDDGGPTTQNCTASDANPTGCTLTANPLVASSLTAYEFLFANTVQNDAGACKTPASQGWNLLGVNNGGYQTADYQVVDLSQSNYTFTCLQLGDPLIIVADGIQSTGLSDFSLTPGPAMITANQGSTATSWINFTSINGFSGKLNLTLSITPSSGLTCGIGRGFVYVSSQSSLNYPLSCGGLVGTYKVTVIATIITQSHNSMVTVTIQSTAGGGGSGGSGSRAS